MKHLFYLLVILLIGCSTIKEVEDKSKIKTDENYSEKQTIRKGDTVVFTVPKISYRDTVIYTTNKQGTLLKTIYDSNGNISQIECQASTIAEISKIYSKLIEEQKDLATKTEKDFLNQVLPYIIYGVVFLVAFALVLIALLVYVRFK